MKPTWRSNDLLGRTRNKQEHFEALPRPLHIQYSRARQSQEHADTRSLRGQRRSLEKVRVRNTRRSRKTGGLLSLAPAARLGLAGGEKGAARVVVLAGIDELPLPRSRRVTSASSPAMTAAIWVAAAERSEVIVYAKSLWRGRGWGPALRRTNNARGIERRSLLLRGCEKEKGQTSVSKSRAGQVLVEYRPCWVKDRRASGRRRLWVIHQVIVNAYMASFTDRYR